MLSAPKSLQEECMVIVIKHDLPRNLLPDIVKDEVDQYERKIISTFSGRFCGPYMFCSFTSTMEIKGSTLSVSWKQGRIKLTLESNESSLEEKEVESLTIKAGKETSLGNLAIDQFMLPGRLGHSNHAHDPFMLPGRRGTIHDFRIDVSRGLLSLHGSCSSTVNDCVFPLEILFGFFVFDYAPLKIFTFTSNRGGEPWHKSFVFHEYLSDMISESDSESSE